MDTMDTEIIERTKPIPQILDLSGIGESGKQLLSARHPGKKRMTF